MLHPLVVEIAAGILLISPKCNAGAMMIGSIKANLGACRLDRHEIATGEWNQRKQGKTSGERAGFSPPYTIIIKLISQMICLAGARSTQDSGYWWIKYVYIYTHTFPSSLPAKAGVDEMETNNGSSFIVILELYTLHVLYTWEEYATCCEPIPTVPVKHLTFTYGIHLSNPALPAWNLMMVIMYEDLHRLSLNAYWICSCIWKEQNMTGCDVIGNN